MAQSAIRKCRLDELKKGMVVGREILTESGRLLVAPGTVLDDYLLTRLAALAIFQVEIIELQEPDYVNAAQVGVADAKLDIATLNKMFLQTDPVLDSDQQAFSSEYSEMLKGVKFCFSTVRLDNNLDLEQLLLVTEKILALSFRGPALVNHLHLTKREDDYLIYHSVDVALLSGFIATALSDLTLAQERDLVLAALLHDIGKISIPLKVLNKVGQLSEEEFEIVRSHPTAGYKFLKDCPGVSQAVQYGVLQHHERMDGSGYPLHTKGVKTHIFAKIIGLADVYSAMTSIKAYGQTLSPFVAADTIKKDMYAGKFDASICDTFISHLYDSLVGSVVMLSDGRKAQVVYWNDNAKGKFLFKTKDGEIFDLSKNPDLQITRMVAAEK